MSPSILTSIKELKNSGIPVNQAEAICSVVQSNLQCKDLATKTDLNLSISEVRNEIKELRIASKTDLNLAISEVRHEIKDLRTEMHLLGNRFFLALGAASVGIVSFLQFFKN